MPTNAYYRDALQPVIQPLLEALPVASMRTVISDYLYSAYNQPTRGYHNWRHLWYMLTVAAPQLDTYKHLPDSQKESLQWAVLFHDCTYAQGYHIAPSNEDMSANVAVALLTEAGFGPQVDIVRSLIEFTDYKKHQMGVWHSTTPEIKIYDLIRDLDLAALGAPWDEFRENNEVRLLAESGLPVDVYQLRMEEFMRYLQDVEIYNSKEARAKWHDFAQENIKQLLAKWKPV